MRLHDANADVAIERNTKHRVRAEFERDITRISLLVLQIGSRRIAQCRRRPSVRRESCRTIGCAGLRSAHEQLVQRGPVRLDLRKGIRPTVGDRVGRINHGRRHRHFPVKEIRVVVSEASARELSQCRQMAIRNGPPIHPALANSLPVVAIARKRQLRCSLGGPSGERRREEFLKKLLSAKVYSASPAQEYSLPFARPKPSMVKPQ